MVPQQEGGGGGEVKHCNKCNTTKPIEDWGTHKNTKDGLQNWCKECFRLYRLEHAEEHKSYINEYYAKGGYGTQPTQEHPTYHAMHCRIRSVKGRASNYICPCGSWAQDWSYNRGCAGEVMSERNFPYCYHVDHYEPLCRACHRIKDTQLSVRSNSNKETADRGGSEGG